MIPNYCITIKSKQDRKADVMKISAVLNYSEVLAQYSSPKVALIVFIDADG